MYVLQCVFVRDDHCKIIFVYYKTNIFFIFLLPGTLLQKKVPLCLLSLDKTRKNQQAFTTIYLVYRTISPSLHFVFLKFYASMNKCREEKYK